MNSRKRDRSLMIVILSGIGTFVLGVIITPAFSYVVNSKVNSANRVIVASSLCASGIFLLALIILTVLHTSTMKTVRLIGGQVEMIEERTGIKVEFQSHDPTKKSDPYAIMIKLVEQAQHELLVLDHRPGKNVPRFGPKITLANPQRKRYYDLLNQKVSQPTPDGRLFRYRRVIQLDTGPISVWDSTVNGDEIFARHCNKVIELRQLDSRCPSAIKTSSVFFHNSSIVVVDGRLVLLELAIEAGDGGTRIQGDLLFHDPEGTLANPLREMFDYIDASANLIVSVT